MPDYFQACSASLCEESAREAEHSRRQVVLETDVDQGYETIAVFCVHIYLFHSERKKKGEKTASAECCRAKSAHLSHICRTFERIFVRWKLAHTIFKIDWVCDSPRKETLRKIRVQLNSQMHCLCRESLVILVPICRTFSNFLKQSGGCSLWTLTLRACCSWTFL